MPTYRLHDTTGDDLGLLEHPAPNVEPGDVLVLPDGRGGARTARVGDEPGQKPHSRTDNNGLRATREANMTTGTQDGSAFADRLLQRIGDAVGGRAMVSAVFGEPVEREGITVIPVAKARFGFGGGGGGGAREGDEGSGGGGGGGAFVSPVGFIEVRDGTAQFKRISSTVDLLALVVATSLTALTIRRLLAG